MDAQKKQVTTYKAIILVGNLNIMDRRRASKKPQHDIIPPLNIIRLIHHLYVRYENKTPCSYKRIKTWGVIWQNLA
jgi:hypothetical protein